ncbi:hypothetical protein V8F06_014694, partial [Rhypophila decipiens]
MAGSSRKRSFGTAIAPPLPEPSKKRSLDAATTLPVRDPSIDDYTIGWICALQEEFEVACRMLDEEFDGPETNEVNDNNTYVFGRINRHSIVIGCLPEGRYGTNSAASVARNMVRSFPNLRFALMVGIGGGAPMPERDIRLGDVVISVPQGVHGGVVQYDLGKRLPGDRFQRTGQLNAPPELLLAVLPEIRRRHNDPRKPDRIAEHLKLMDDMPDYRCPAQDKLFRTNYEHKGGETCTYCEDSGLEKRLPRSIGRAVTFHYGTIASANSVMKNAVDRDRFALDPELKVLCFEMEAAGLMNNFPCLVIRGICDYSDSHKNDEWHKYAALTAAAYARELLYLLKPQRVSTQSSWVEKMRDFETILHKTHQAIQDGNTLQKKIYKNKKDTQCLQDLHLTDPHEDKKRIEDTKGGLLPDVYQWVLNSSEFRQWRNSPDSHLLWIRGDPGKGKTMLICGIIDELQRSTSGTSLLSFFFCQAADSRINKATAILRGLIYLLLDQQPSLMPHVLKKYDHAGKKLFEDANAWVALSEILRNILQDPNLEGAYLIIDALDECIEDLPKLLKFIVEMSSKFPRVKWIVSSRNWPDIEKDLKEATQKVRLCLELNEASVSKAVTAYVNVKVNWLAERNKYKPDTRMVVLSYLSENAHGTFLWVALVCQELANISGWKARKKLAEFPPGLNALYQRMMNQICDSVDAELCKSILAVMSTVRRPITSDELAALVDIPEEACSDYEVLKEILGLCGSFLTLRERTISFIHQSAKDYLLEKAAYEVFPSGIEDIHYTIFSRSLRIMTNTLRRDIYNLAMPGSLIDNVKIPAPDPLAAARYACVYWVDHLYDWQSSDNINHPDVFQDGGIIDDFLRQHYLHWLEALSLCKSMSQGILSIGKLESVLQQRTIISQLLNLVYDMRRFVLYCGWLVENHPLQVYASALVFSPARSTTRDLFKQEMPKWITSGPVVEENWTACRQTLEGHSYSVTSVAFSPDSKLVVSGSGSWDQTIKIWDAVTGTCTQTLAGHSSDVCSVAFSPDSKLVVSGSDDKTVKIWDAVTGTCTQTLAGHSGYVCSVAFSPDSKLVVSGSWDQTIKIWDAVTGTCTQTLAGHSGYVHSVAFSPDSKLVVSGSDDKTVKIWDAVTGTCT